METGQSCEVLQPDVGDQGVLEVQDCELCHSLEVLQVFVGDAAILEFDSCPSPPNHATQLLNLSDGLLPFILLLLS